MLREIIEVKPIGGLRLFLRFDDGLSGEINLAERLHFVGLLQSLKDPEYFAKVQLIAEAGTIGWPNGVDLDPSVLYAWVAGLPVAEHGSDIDSAAELG